MFPSPALASCLARPLALACALLVAGPILAQQPAAPPQVDEAQRNADLEKTLTGATLVGRFTVTGADGEPSEERYELQAVKHLEGDVWLITARIKYGNNDVAVPLPLPIRWAGDTPVITVDEFPVPGLGTYTARVMIYRDHYAGFWSGKDHGGHLFGIVERAKPGEAAGSQGASASPAPNAGN